MKMLNTEKALQLYKLLKPHFPDDVYKFDITELIRIIIDSMVEKNYRDYTDVLMLMHDVSLESMRDVPSEEILKLFVEGLAENNVYELMDFFGKKVRYGVS